jgi:LPXTG-motif cell wall-anchored protein
MKTIDGRSHLLQRLVAGAFALMVTMTIGNALAAIPTTTAYRFSSHPMISGTVVTVNDHQMVVNTDQGEQVTLEMDSRTMAPRDLAPGMVMRADFVALEDCHFYAQRIEPIRGGMSTERLQAYANTHDSHEAMARNASGSSGYWRSSSASPFGTESRGIVSQTMSEQSPGATMTATPTTADYQFSTRPMISGRVVSVNDHRLVVDTNQGQQVGMAMDSRTLLSGDVAPGADVSVEFRQMKDGRYYAQRLHLIGSDTAEREQAYAHTRDGEVLLAGNLSDCGHSSAGTGSTAMSALQLRESVEPHDSVVAQSVPVPVVEELETLPQTASDQPLLLFLGLLGLLLAGLVVVVRGLRKV